MCQKAREFPISNSEYPSSNFFHVNTPIQSEEFGIPKMKNKIEEKDKDEENLLQNSQKSININFSQNQINNNNENQNQNPKFYITKNSFQNDTMTNQNTEKRPENINNFLTKYFEQNEKEPNIEIKNKKSTRNIKIKIRKDRLRTSYVKHFYIDLVNFINFLINKFNKEKGKNFKFLIEKILNFI